MLAHTCNHRAQEAKAGKSQVWGHPGLHYSEEGKLGKRNRKNIGALCCSVLHIHLKKSALNSMGLFITSKKMTSKNALHFQSVSEACQLQKILMKVYQGPGFNSKQNKIKIKGGGK